MIPNQLKLNPDNNFVDKLKEVFPLNCSALFICSDPNAYELTDESAQEMKSSFENSGIAFSKYYILDNRNVKDAEILVSKADVLILAGGHVPTQNKFFNGIHLKSLINHTNKVIIGFSAGSMNSAEVVYSQPELEGEAVSKDYRRFLCGLGITRKMILPHYQFIKDKYLDGMELFEEITYPDSLGREFYALVDGSYLYGEENLTERIFGEAYLIKEGQIKQIKENFYEAATKFEV
jgi:dipeptidase E